MKYLMGLLLAALLLGSVVYGGMSPAQPTKVSPPSLAPKPEAPTDTPTEVKLTPEQITEVRNEQANLDYDQLLEDHHKDRDVHPKPAVDNIDLTYRIKITYKYNNQIIAEDSQLYKPGHWTIVEVKDVRKYRFLITPTDNPDKFIFGFWAEYTYDPQGKFHLTSGVETVFNIAADSLRELCGDGGLVYEVTLEKAKPAATLPAK